MKLTWVAVQELPPTDRVTSAHGFCFWQGQVLVVDLRDRGGDIPGGHVGPGETLVDCFRREVREEGYVSGGTCTLLGYCIVDHGENPTWEPGGKYPKVGYQVYYRMDVEAVLPFGGEFESSRRLYVAPEALPHCHHSWNGILEHGLRAAMAG